MSRLVPFLSAAARLCCSRASGELTGMSSRTWDWRWYGPCILHHSVQSIVQPRHDGVRTWDVDLWCRTMVDARLDDKHADARILRQSVLRQVSTAICKRLAERVSYRAASVSPEVPPPTTM